MKRPSDEVLRGLDVLRPYIMIGLEFPDDSDMQECSEVEIYEARQALEWIEYLLESAARRTPNPLNRPFPSSADVRPI